MSAYVVLLRAVNVGGRNRVPMSDLRTALEEAGYASVRTYIQSGNVLLRSNASADDLNADIARLLAERFDVTTTSVVRTDAELASVISGAPKGFGTEPGTYHTDVLFLKASLTTDQAMAVVKLREGVDEVWPGDGVLYFRRLSARRTQSKLSAIVGTPEYKQLTIRTWTTTVKLHEMLRDLPE